MDSLDSPLFKIKMDIMIIKTEILQLKDDLVSYFDSILNVHIDHFRNKIGLNENQHGDYNQYLKNEDRLNTIRTKNLELDESIYDEESEEDSEEEDSELSDESTDEGFYEESIDEDSIEEDELNFNEDDLFKSKLNEQLNKVS
jgi:hypothetical protein